MLVWKNLKLFRHSFPTLEAVAQSCSVRKSFLRNFARPATLFKKETLAQVFSCEVYKISKNTSGGCSSFHITINSSVSSILFDFCRHLILRNIKNLSRSCFFLCNISTFDVCFLTCSNLASECEISDNNSKKLDEHSPLSPHSPHSVPRPCIQLFIKPWIQ